MQSLLRCTSEHNQILKAGQIRRSKSTMVINPSSPIVANRAIYAAPEFMSDRRSMQWDISKSYVQLAGFSTLAVFNLADLASKVQESLHCRIFDRSVAANNWARQRLESKAHTILNPDGIIQLGVKFGCIYCKAIHLAPCHQGRGDGYVRAREDPAVDLVTLPWI